MYGWILRVLFPPAYRDQYGPAMEEVFRQQWAGVRPQGWRHVAVFFAATLRDLIGSAWLVWIRRLPSFAAVRSEAFQSFRFLRRHPLHSLSVVGTLTLGLSATLLAAAHLKSYTRPIPGTEPGLLRLLYQSGAQPSTGIPQRGDPADPTANGATSLISWPDFQDYQAASAGTMELAAVQSHYAASVRTESQTDIAHIEVVTGNFFRTAGVRARRGRVIQPFDDQPEATPVVVVTSTWYEGRGRPDNATIGSTIHLNGRPFVIVGVVHPGYQGTRSDYRPELFIPFTPFRDRYGSWAAQAERRDRPTVQVWGRVADPTSAPSGSRARTMPRVQTMLPVETMPPGATMLPAETPTGDTTPLADVLPPAEWADAQWTDPSRSAAEAKTNVSIIATAVLFLLLAVINATNLMWASMTARTNRFAVRAFLGASPRRIAGEITLQTGFLAMAAGALSLLLVPALGRRFTGHASRPTVWDDAVVSDFLVDTGVAASAMAIAIVVALVMAIPLVLEVRKKARRVRRGGRVFVSAQAMVATTLLVVSGLVLKSLFAASSVEPGFDPTGLVTSQVTTSSVGSPSPDPRPYFRDLLTALNEEDWVASASLASRGPFARHPVVQAESTNLALEQVRPGYLSTMRIPLLHGRDLAADDLSSPLQTTVLSSSAAETLFPDDDPIGQVFRFSYTDGTVDSAKVVGISADVRIADLLLPAPPTLYLHHQRLTVPSDAALVVRVPEGGDHIMVAQQLREWIAEYESQLAIINAVSYEEVMEGAVFLHRRNAEFFTILSGLGLLLAFLGTFSLVSLTVSQRTREIGLRRAIGATPASVHRTLVWDGILPVTFGIIPGVVVAFLGSAWTSSLLYGVKPWDPLAFVGAPVLLLACSALAATVPALRAGHIHVMNALRSE